MLLHRRGLGVALDHQQPAQHGAVFAGHLLPRLLALVRAERNFPLLHRRRQQHAPAILRHPHVAELRPAFRADADRGAQIHQAVLEPFRSHLPPPVDVAGMPGLQRLAHALIVVQTDVVRDQAVVVDRCSVWHRLTSLRIEIRPQSAAVALQRTLLADRVRPLEHPVLPCGQPAEDARLHRLRSGEAQVGLHRGQRVGRERRALLQHQPHLVIPVRLVTGGGDEPERLGILRIQRLAHAFARLREAVGLAEEAGRQPRQPIAHRIRTEIQCRQMQMAARDCRRRACR